MLHRTHVVSLAVVATSLLSIDAQAGSLWRAPSDGRSPSELRVDLDGDGVEDVLEIVVTEDEPHFQPSEKDQVDAWLWREVYRVRGKQRDLVFRAHAGFSRRGKPSLEPVAFIERALDYDGDGRLDLVYSQGDEDGSRLMLVMQEADGTFVSHDFGSTLGDFPSPSFEPGQSRVLPVGVGKAELTDMGIGDIAIDWDKERRRFAGKGLYWVVGNHVQIRDKPVSGKVVARAFDGDLVVEEGPSRDPEWAAVQAPSGASGFVHRRFLSRDVPTRSSRVRGLGRLPKVIRLVGASWVSDFDGDGTPDRVRLATMKATPRGASIIRLSPEQTLPKTPLTLVYDFADQRVMVVGLENTGLMLPPVSRDAISLKEGGGALELHTEGGPVVELACPKRKCALIYSDDTP